MKWKWWNLGEKGVEDKYSSTVKQWIHFLLYIPHFIYFYLNLFSNAEDCVFSVLFLTFASVLILSILTMKKIKETWKLVDLRLMKQVRFLLSTCFIYIMKNCFFLDVKCSVSVVNQLKHQVMNCSCGLGTKKNIKLFIRDSISRIRMSVRMKDYQH